MSTSTPSSPICPRSILRYRPIDNTTTNSTGDASQSVKPWRRMSNYAPRKTLPTKSTTGTGTASSTRKLTRKIPSAPRNTPRSQTITREQKPRRGSLFSGNYSSATLVTMLGLGMILTLTLIMLGQMLFAWGGNVLDDLRYGNPRTFQTDAYVGHDEHGQPSHFIALNNKGQIEIIELPGNNASRARIFMGPKLTGPNADRVPVTLRFVDTRHNHQPDMIVDFQGTSVVFTNTNGTFRPAQAAELSEVTQGG